MLKAKMSTMLCKVLHGLKYFVLIYYIFRFQDDFIWKHNDTWYIPELCVNVVIEHCLLGILQSNLSIVIFLSPPFDNNWIFLYDKNHSFLKLSQDNFQAILFVLKLLFIVKSLCITFFCKKIILSLIEKIT